MKLIRPVIIAGGPGARLWPLSDATRPKPFLKLDGKKSLLDDTLARLANGKQFEAPIIACAVSHGPAARAAMKAAGLTPALILEPEPRDTAAAVAAIVAARRAAGANDELLLIAPADHVIGDGAAFRAGLARGAELAKSGRLVLFGATPTSAHTGFGYIETASAADVSDIASFQEKPQAPIAEQFFKSGRHLWNMGMFLAPVSTFAALFEAHAPEIYAVAQRAVAEGKTADGALTLAAEVFKSAAKAPFDRAVVEKTRGGAVVRLSVGWSDVGAWDAVYDTLPMDKDGNAVVGDARLLDAKNMLVHSSGPRVAAIGVEGLAIIATGDSVLVCRLDDAQKVKTLVEAMKTEKP